LVFIEIGSGDRAPCLIWVYLKRSRNSARSASGDEYFGDKANGAANHIGCRPAR